MEWESMTAEQWESMTEQEWEAMVEAEQQREAISEGERADEAMLEEEKADEAMLADAEIEEAEPEPEMPPPPPPVEVWSLRAGQVFAANIAGAGAFRLRAVAVNNAAALEAVLVQQVADRAWVIPALPNLTALSRVDLLLTLGIDAHVPILFDNLYTVDYLEAFRDWTWDLQTAATGFGGIFSKCKSVKSICQGLRKVIAGALNLRRTEEWLVDKLNTALADLKALKVSTAFFEA